MKDKQKLETKDLKRVTGGYFPEDVGDPVIIPPGIESYKVCDKCGGVMTPAKIRQVAGKSAPIPREYICTECGARTEIITIFKTH